MMWKFCFQVELILYGCTNNYFANRNRLINFFVAQRDKACLE
jgi:hypothetical protein